MIAVIPAAGHGTRFSPFTRLIPKEMLPVGARPAIALIVDEAIEAGADEIVIVTSPEKPLLRRWFELEPPPVKLSWVDQLEQRGLGHAVLQAAPLIWRSEEPVLILLGDALVSGGNAAAAMMKESLAHGGASVLGCERVPRDRVSRYGILKPAVPLPATTSGSLFPISDIVEKPKAEEAPSDLAVAGRYLLDPLVFELLKDQQAGVGGEIQLTDAIRRLVAKRPVFGFIYLGRRQDIGNPDGYYKALEAYRAHG